MDATNRILFLTNSTNRLIGGSTLTVKDIVCILGLIVIAWFVLFSTLFFIAAFLQIFGAENAANAVIRLMFKITFTKPDKWERPR